MKSNILQRNHVNISGKGTKAILFGAGFGCDQTVWREVSKAFENEYQIILFDYVGAGKSDFEQYDEKRYSTLKGYAQDVLDVCEALDVKDAIFVGHSVGSMIGMLASVEKPELFSDLIMIGPSPCYLNDPPEYFGGFEKEQLSGLLDMMDKNYIGWANYFAGAVTNNPERLDVQQEMEDRFCSTDPVFARQFAEATFFSDYREELKLVKVPTLILQCSDDIIAPTKVGEYMHDNINGSVLIQLEAVGHCPHMSDPEETIGSIRHYLKEKEMMGVNEKRGVHI